MILMRIKKVRMGKKGARVWRVLVNDNGR